MKTSDANDANLVYRYIIDTIDNVAAAGRDRRGSSLWSIDWLPRHSLTPLLIPVLSADVLENERTHSTSRARACAVFSIVIVLSPDLASAFARNVQLLFSHAG